MGNEAEECLSGPRITYDLSIIKYFQVGDCETDCEILLLDFFDELRIAKNG